MVLGKVTHGASTPSRKKKKKSACNFSTFTLDLADASLSHSSACLFPFFLTTQQKRKLRIYISNTYTPCKPEGEETEKVSSWELRVEGKLLEEVSQSHCNPVFWAPLLRLSGWLGRRVQMCVERAPRRPLRSF